MLLTLIGFSVAGVVFYMAWTLYTRILRPRSSKDAPSIFSKTLRKRLPFFSESGADGFELLARGRDREREHPV